MKDAVRGLAFQLKNQKSRRLARLFVVDDVFEAQLGLGISACGDFALTLRLVPQLKERQQRAFGE